MRLDSHMDVYLFEQGRAYTLLGRSKEAVSALKRFSASHPDSLGAHLLLAIDYVELGHDDAARAQAAEILRLDPQFSAEAVFPRGDSNGKALVLKERAVADLRKAGLK